MIGGTDDLRCADSDREAVVDVLMTAYADGRITRDEHDERTERAYAARTFRELNVLTRDLVPGGGGTVVPGQSVAIPGDRPAVPVTHFSRGTAIMSTHQATPPLRVATTSALTTVMGSIHIDLVDATYASQTVEFNITNFMGEVRIRVPEGVRVVEQLSNTSMSEVRINGLVRTDNDVTVVLRGTVVMGTINVLGPDTRPKKYRRFIR